LPDASVKGNQFWIRISQHSPTWIDGEEDSAASNEWLHKPATYSISGWKVLEQIVYEPLFATRIPQKS